MPGWHAYWRSPGDAGIPPSIEWAGPTNLAHAEIAWPVPDPRDSIMDWDSDYRIGESKALPIHPKSEPRGRLAGGLGGIDDEGEARPIGSRRWLRLDHCRACFEGRSRCERSSA
jgi:hypothetical protein